MWLAEPQSRALARSLSSEMHSGFLDLRDQLGMEFASKLPLPELRESTQKEIARLIEAWSDALAQYKGDFLFGHFTIADCMFAPVASRFETYGVPVPPIVRGYMDRVLALPAMTVWRKGAETEVAAGIA